MRRLSVPDIVLITVMIALAAFTLAPAIARIQRTPAEAKCQANLQRWAEAMELYVTDNSGFYPTNRPRFPSGQLGPILPSVILSPPDPIPPATEPTLHYYGPNWIEALYPYLQSAAERTGQDWKSFRKCPNASTLCCPPIPGVNCFVSYTFNRCLVEQHATLARDRKKLMMLREFSRMTISMLRPANDCTANSTSKPIDPFLYSRDVLIPANSGYKLHGEGSYIVFADGHIEPFDISYFATDPPNYRTSASTYDPNTQQWYNYYFANPTTPDQQAKNKSIAISP